MSDSPTASCESGEARNKALREHKHDRAVRPDAQPFDEVRIVTVPRYKESGMSGDEWRISAKIQLLRKGKVVFEDHRGNIEAAARHLAWIIDKATDDGKAYFGGEGDTCDQEGCSDKATVTYRVKRTYCSTCGKTERGSTEEEVARTLSGGNSIRQFCERHKRRGDCGIDDADSNYERV